MVLVAQPHISASTYSLTGRMWLREKQLHPLAGPILVCKFAGRRRTVLTGMVMGRGGVIYNLASLNSRRLVTPMIRCGERMMKTLALFDLTGRVAVVTGGNGGLGRSIALGLAEAGAAVAVLGRNDEKNQRMLSELKAIGVPSMAVRVDVTNRAGLESALNRVESELGSISIHVNNGGWGKQPKGPPAFVNTGLQNDSFFILMERQTALFMEVYPAKRYADRIAYNSICIDKGLCPTNRERSVLRVRKKPSCVLHHCRNAGRSDNRN